MTLNIQEPLSPFELRKLSALLANNTCTLAECHGLLSAVVSAPSMIPPSVWTAKLVGDNPMFADATSAQEGMGLLMRFYNSIAASFPEGNFAPFDYPNAGSIVLWCRGFLRGSRLDVRWWTDDEGPAFLMPMSVLAGEFNLQGEEDADGNVITDVSKYITRYSEELPKLVAGAYHYWAEKRRAPAAPVQPQSAGRGPKTRPNEPCPCGSGKKYKKCCGKPL